MPQDINFQQLAATYNISWEKVNSWAQLSESLNPLPDQGIRILEINCNCQNDTQWRTIVFKQFTDGYQFR
jgi:2-succinyl-5-enolpyruvyl-6-hydroxy-3-cyclohexene-1-carboxylate synthase